MLLFVGWRDFSVLLEIVLVIWGHILLVSGPRSALDRALFAHVQDLGVILVSHTLLQVVL